MKIVKIILTLFLLTVLVSCTDITSNTDIPHNNNLNSNNNNVNSDNNTNDDNNNINNDVVFTYYTVTFNSQDGSSIESQSIIEGNPVRIPSNPERDGFSFSGWYTTAECTEGTKWNFSTSRINSDITLYAKWVIITPELEPTRSLTYTRVPNGYEVTGVGDEERVIIPSTYEGRNVVGIANSAFARKQITYVYIPSTVTRIGLNAFNNASSLVEVVIPEDSQLVSIENNAFSGNSSLKSIYLPSTLVSIGNNAFNNASSLNSITVANDNPRYSSEGNNLIDKQTNTLIRGTNSSVIPDGVRIIGTAAFRRSTLETINIPASVVEIGNYVFDDCTSLKEINVNSSNTVYSSYDGVLYSKDLKALIEVPENYEGELELSRQLETINSYSFDGRSNITVIMIHRGVANFAFGSFRNLTCQIQYEGSQAEWDEITKHSLWGGVSLEVVYNSIF